MIPLDDRGFTLGDGLFETVLAEGGELKQLQRHLARLQAGCAVIGLPAPDLDQAGRLMRAALKEAGLGGERAAVRLTYTAGSGGRGLDRPDAPAPRLVATAAPAPKPVGPARMVITAVARNDRSPASRLKTLAYLDNVLARAEARAAGADEAVMLNTHGQVACAAAANVFWEAGGRLFTPALECGALAGIMRARAIDAAREQGVAVEEVRTGPHALLAAEAVFLTNALIGLRPVSMVGERAYPLSRLMERLAGALG